ncbi:precorrin-3B C(17)-methyltransferase [uncultured Treponema sp.]|uniref:precorrin-3B C(17)-methyltransferase n=1 Tax=uncultured Treponema sp. TaxID=162155 RepID=UPI0025D80665|nr:precorrin-3B C(17)-methyltransferase [uncultured Treponema sp.]
MKSGILQVVGIGPGNYDMMTVQCVKALKDCDCIIGYDVYIDLVKEHFPDKEFKSTPMRKEEERCRLAVEEALSGKNVALICSGDAGVYGMSGLAFEIAAEYEASRPDEKIQISVIPGITAALSGSALLGAPLIHDFAVISLSDLMTPWEKIEKRLDLASKADFCVVLYNPMSHKRKDYLFKACQIMAKNISETTPCAYVKNIGRKGEEFKILTLKELSVSELDMFCTVFIGNSQTKIIEVNGQKQLVTPRGYVFERGEK